MPLVQVVDAKFMRFAELARMPPRAPVGGSTDSDWQVVHPRDYSLYTASDPYTVKPRLLEWLTQKVKNRQITWDLRTKFVVVFRAEPLGQDAPTDGDGKPLRRLLVDLYRIDNMVDSPAKQSHYCYKPFDCVWRGLQGWPEDLLLDLLATDSDGERLLVAVPASAEQDSVRMTILLREEYLKQHFWLHGAAQAPTATPTIPLIIHQTWSSRDNLPSMLHKSVYSFQSLNPSFEHRLATDPDMRSQIARLEPMETLLAFDALRPSAFKADLWRYVVLYHFGGVYADIKLTLLAPLGMLLPAQGALLVNDIRGAGLYNGFMALPPRDPLMRIAIDEAVRRISGRAYPENILAITGPKLLEDAYTVLVKTYGHQVVRNYTRLQFDMTGIGVRAKQGTVWSTLASIALHGTIRPPLLMLVHNPEYRRLLSRPGMHDHYEQMFKKRCVYSDDPDCDGVQLPSRAKGLGGDWLGMKGSKSLLGTMLLLLVIYCVWVAKQRRRKLA